MGANLKNSFFYRVNPKIPSTCDYEGTDADTPSKGVKKTLLGLESNAENIQ
jgi:hypothetical protein